MKKYFLRHIVEPGNFLYYVNDEFITSNKLYANIIDDEEFARDDLLRIQKLPQFKDFEFQLVED